jgi:hypothetical protein
LGEELKGIPVVAKFATTTKHGAIEGKTQSMLTEHYNLDVIISVGYRVKSKQGTQFRIWATNVLRDYLLKGYALNQRMDRIENNYENLSNEVKQISLQIKNRDLPNQGIFFNGQIFDAYVFVSEIFKNAKSEIILIDRTELYHIGASLKDLGKKWFAFSRFDSLAGSLLSMLNK